MTVLRPTRFLLLAMMAGCTGLRQWPGDASAVDADDVPGAVDARPDLLDAGEPRDRDIQADTPDAGSAVDAPDAGSAVDAPDAGSAVDAPDAGSAVDAPDVIVAADVADARDVVDAPASPDVDPGALTLPRLRAPLGGTSMSTGRVTFRWFPVPGQDAEVEVCPDARCTTVARVLSGGAQGSVAVPVALAPGTWWWRVRPTIGGLRGLTPSATWHFMVEGRGTAPASPVGLLLDPDADGRRDLYVGAVGARMGAGDVRVWMRTADIVQGAYRVLGPLVQRGAGWAVAPAGDLTGDGLPEVAYSVMTSLNENGEVVVIRGARDGSLRHMTRLATDFDDLTYGASIAGLGDIDGDGFGDFAVGRPAFFNNQDGAVFIFNGAAGGLRGWDGLTRPIHSAVLRGASTRDNAFGRVVAGVGDLDGDGYADVVVGSPPRETATPGEVCVYRGGPSGLTPEPFRIPAPQALPASFGWNVVGAGDLNGDGLADFAVSGGTRTDPQVYVFYGGPAGPRSTPDAVLRPPDAALNFGSSLAGVGDIDRDGWADLAVGAPHGVNEGRIFLYRGGPAGVDAATPYALRSAEAALRFGARLGSRGDVDGDGVPDLVVGDPTVDRDAGRVWIFRGATGGLDPVRWRVLEGTADGERFGHAL